MVTYDRDESDDIREAAEAAEVVPCRVCDGTGVVWPPAGHVGPLHVTGDVVVTGNVVSSGFRDLLQSAGTVDFVVPNVSAWPDADTLVYGGELALPFNAHVTLVYEAGKPTPTMHPERKRVLDFLATLPEDMPIGVLTPKSRKELQGFRDFVERTKSGTLAARGAEALADRMEAYWKELGRPDVLEYPSGRLAGLPTTEGDEG